MSTGIEWTDETWNPTTGCTRVSAGCENCYIETTIPFRMEDRAFRDKDGVRSHAVGSSTGVRLHPDRLDQPLRWRKSRRVFVNSMSDLFHEDIPDEFIARVFAVMSLAPKHTFQVLTKRHGRMRSLLNSWGFRCLVHDAETEIAGAERDEVWPLPNVWAGVSVEDQKAADLRVPALLDTPAAVRFLSCEPLLGPVALDGIAIGWWANFPDEPYDGYMGGGIGWVIVGGESGRDARPMHPDWARSLRDQCAVTGVPFFFKQRGEWTWNEPGQFTMPAEPHSDRVAVMHPAGMLALTKDNPFDPFERGHPDWATRIARVGKRAAGRELDGRTHDDYPKGHQA